MSVTALPTRVDVAVIGGGVMGTSIAARLAENGASVALLEKQTLGCGSSAKPIGGFRAQFSDETNIALGLRSLTEHLLPFRRRYGVDIDLVQCGYLFLLTDEQQVEGYAAAAALQRSMGVDSAVVDPAEVHRLNPYVPAGSVLAGQFSPMAGHLRPAGMIRGFADLARRHGATMHEYTPVSGITAAADGEALLHTPAGEMRAGAVVIAAGAWSGEVGALAGIDLPVRPLRRQLAFTAPGAAGTPPLIPFTLDAATTGYFHNVGPDRLLFGFADQAEPEGFGTDWDEGWLAGFRAFAAERAPELAAMPVESGWAGLYEMTPDRNAVIGEATGGAFRTLYAAGFSGHGVLQSPAVGEVVADLYAGRAPFTDVSRFSADRFSGGGAGLAHELAVI
ncbi:FAD-dependent oxidoreductase [Nakamurella sp. YIM 132087]|uniref:FAD-dependent oxidoreductase n=1 Tax=Nakamurella alba TaxID=2665158 RepID=A0A7K1FQU2_9ACTN|nr:FAD-dependent oxidoreductase [Nakamurella alba]